MHKKSDGRGRRNRTSLTSSLNLSCSSSSPVLLIKRLLSVAFFHSRFRFRLVYSAVTSRLRKIFISFDINVFCKNEMTSQKRKSYRAYLEPDAACGKVPRQTRFNERVRKSQTSTTTTPTVSNCLIRANLFKKTFIHIGHNNINSITSRDSNPRPQVLQQNALSLELLLSSSFFFSFLQENKCTYLLQLHVT